MVGDSDQKILDAALKVFSKFGYKGATIKEIAGIAGFSELTVFKKFENKKNLYEMVMIHNMENVKRDFLSIFSDKEFETPKNYLMTIIKDIGNAMDNNVEFIQLAQTETSSAYSSFVKEFHIKFAEHLEKNIKNDKINYLSFALEITSFLYLGSVNNKIIDFLMDPEIIMNGFIDNKILFIQI